MDSCAQRRDGGIVQKYHDEERGIAQNDGTKHSEYISVMRRGLNGIRALKKRDVLPIEIKYIEDPWKGAERGGKQ